MTELLAYSGRGRGRRSRPATGWTTLTDTEASGWRRHMSPGTAKTHWPLLLRRYEVITTLAGAKTRTRDRIGPWPGRGISAPALDGSCRGRRRRDPTEAMLAEGRPVWPPPADSRLQIFFHLEQLVYLGRSLHLTRG